MFTRRFAEITCSALMLGAALAAPARAQDEKLEDRAKSAARVLANLVSDPKNSPPNGLLRSAVCIAAVPSVKEAALVVGGKVGYGLASCRVGDGWSLPSFMAIKGGSVGFQIGGQAIDVVLVFTHADAPKTIATSNFELGGQASIAAGPVGSTIGAATDFSKGAAIYSYSTKGAGAFAGVSLAGSKYEVDSKANRTVYPAASVPTAADKTPDVSHLVKTRAGAETPAAVMPFVTALEERIGARR
ncbi:MAG TPA: lipid-binding SYLF domain-containing protein [Gemmatimonadales bacterium]|nr:lipid-binding SYLF domain-containing protein [Gemmatimonadales bacterium]